MRWPSFSVKLRTQPNPLTLDAFKAIGANASPLPWSELFVALETKAFDGQENPVVLMYTQRFYEVQKYMTLSGHVYSPLIFAVSKKFWDGLNAEQKKIISEAAIESAKYQREFNRGQSAGALANLKKGGMQVTELPAAELGKLRDKLRPVTAKYAVNVGQETVQELQAELAKLRK